jgi:hypothetical protein
LPSDKNLNGHGVDKLYTYALSSKCG